jgi:heptosyltransferase III
MAGYLKEHFPGCRIIFLGRTYTRDVVSLSSYVDEFFNYDELQSAAPKERLNMLRLRNADIIVHVLPRRNLAFLAQRAGIPMRAGTTNRVYHWFTCNRLVRFSRRRSTLHEAQLNLKLLSFLKADTNVPLAEFPEYYGFTRLPALPVSFQSMLDRNRTRVILHPRSKGSAKEWGLENFAELVKHLPEDKYQVFIAGTGEDKQSMSEFLAKEKTAIDVTGKMSLAEYIAFINACDALIAASTGPLHIAAALGKMAIGLFSSRRPMHPGRWMPLGKNAHHLVHDGSCSCAADPACDCITRIAPARVKQMLENG